jgi:hypothetical protein
VVLETPDFFLKYFYFALQSKNKTTLIPNYSTGLTALTLYRNKFSIIMSRAAQPASKWLSISRKKKCIRIHWNYYNLKTDNWFRFQKLLYINN